MRNHLPPPNSPRQPCLERGGHRIAVCRHVRGGLTVAVDDVDVSRDLAGKGQLVARLRRELGHEGGDLAGQVVGAVADTSARRGDPVCVATAQVFPLLAEALLHRPAHRRSGLPLLAPTWATDAWRSPTLRVGLAERTVAPVLSRRLIRSVGRATASAGEPVRAWPLAVVRAGGLTGTRPDVIANVVEAVRVDPVFGDLLASDLHALDAVVAVASQRLLPAQVMAVVRDYLRVPGALLRDGGDIHDLIALGHRPGSLGRIVHRKWSTTLIARWWRQANTQAEPHAGPAFLDGVDTGHGIRLVVPRTDRVLIAWAHAFENCLLDYRGPLHRGDVMLVGAVESHERAGALPRMIIELQAHRPVNALKARNRTPGREMTQAAYDTLVDAGAMAPVPVLPPPLCLRRLARAISRGRGKLEDACRGSARAAGDVRVGELSELVREAGYARTTDPHDANAGLWVLRRHGLVPPPYRPLGSMDAD